MAATEQSFKRIVQIVALGAALVALGAGAAYFFTGSTVALRVLWIAGPMALTAGGFVLLQAFMPPDGK